MQVLIFWGGFHAQIQTRFWNIITTVTMSIFYDDLDALIYVFSLYIICENKFPQQ